MTLSPGDEWGRPGHLPTSAAVLSGDAALADLVAATPPGERVVAALTGGDLCRSLGGRGDVATRLGTDTTLLDVDVARAVAGDTEVGLFVAHAVVRNRWWRGSAAVVMNAEWLGPWRVAPRAHPGDGVLDLVQGSLGARERLLARRLARTGDHLPHPALRVQRGPRFELSSDRPRLLLLDGRPRGRFRTVTVEIADRSVSVAV